jgi:hypothetical protein
MQCVISSLYECNMKKFTTLLLKREAILGYGTVYNSSETAHAAINGLWEAVFSVDPDR